jgi:hypothetical protein
MITNTEWLYIIAVVAVVASFFGAIFGNLAGTMAYTRTKKIQLMCDEDAIKNLRPNAGINPLPSFEELEDILNTLEETE